jgi:sugar lactone lactonase YvrE/cytochrome oxidase Cu insertion factor (SCO1/SenC/PrrC family)
LTLTADPRDKPMSDLTRPEAATQPPPPPAPPPTPAAAPATGFPWTLVTGVLCGIVAPFLVIVVMGSPNSTATDDKKNKPEEKEPPVEKKKAAAPELDGGVAWLNSGGPLSIKKDLKGKVVLLDFWTLCCINCIHIQPDLAKLEKKYANELVVIGVHSPKFDNEKDTNSIRKAILRYQIEHPVVNDADHKIWDRYEIDAWPTLVLIDPEGNLVGYTSGEGNYELLDTVIGKIVKDHKEKKTLNEKPINFDLAKYRETGDTPLFFPGKVLADEKGGRLFIADSTHHRIVITDLDGKLIAVAGTGTPGNSDGKFDKTEFHDPQGMAVDGDTLYVADRKNHVIRQLDLKAKTVKTIAGTGEQEREPDNRRLDKPVPARSIGLNSPWDLLIEGDTLYVAMAGHHQIWAYDLKKRDIGPYAGSGRETLGDGPLGFAHFAQPSGLASDGKNLYVADSEISALRKVPLGGLGRVETLVGRGLFVFGDQDGPGQVDDPLSDKKEARLQHALGVTHHDGKLYVADTYNSKIRVFDLKTKELSTLVGGNEWGWLVPGAFSEPGGISYAGGKLYVADTNAHRVRVVDIATKTVKTLELKGVTPPPMPKEPEPKK